MHPILKKLTGGTRRSIGKANQVAAEVLTHPNLFPHLVTALASHDELLRMRAADAIEKITTRNPSLLQPFKKKFLVIASRATQQEVRWHAAQIIPRLDLTPKERTFAMQALADLATTDPKLKSQIIPLLEELTQIGTPAMRARGRKILRKL
jgi:HEAT repeat protein